MKTKEEYYDLVLENRKLAADPQVTKCSCPNTLCDWHGKCKECVALHKYHNDHVPVCLQQIINDKITALASVAEMLTEKKVPTPIEYRHYVKERDKISNKDCSNNFLDVKHRIDEPEIQRVLSLSLLQPASAESIARVIDRCRNNDNRKLWGIVDNQVVIGIVEYYIRDDDTVYIANLAVLNEHRGKGIGRLIIEYLQNNYKLPLELETDDDAIGFYRKCGFETYTFEKNNIWRWKCRLPYKNMIPSAPDFI